MRSVGYAERRFPKQTVRDFVAEGRGLRPPLMRQRRRPKSAGKSKRGGKPMEGYCLKCRAEREIENFERTTMKNGRPAVRGKCAVCGRGMFKIVKKGE